MAARTAALIRDLEGRWQQQLEGQKLEGQQPEGQQQQLPGGSSPGGGGRHVVLVSHGDSLSILASVLRRTPLAEHRQHGMPNCGVMRVGGGAEAAVFC